MKASNKSQALFCALACVLASTLMLLKTAPRPDISVRSERAATAPKQSQAQLSASFGKLPLYFVENRGQLAPQAAYYVQGSDKAVYFTDEGLTFVLHHKRAEPASPPNFQPAFQPASYAPAERYALKLDFIGAQPGVHPVGAAPTDAVISYFKGHPSQWKTGLKTYAQIVYRDLWPGIDLIYAGTVSRMKYSFVVRAGADPSQIKLAYRGASCLVVNDAGALQVQTPAGGFTDDRPVSFQEVNGQQQPIQTAYKLADDGATAYGFTISAYDRSRELIIDPALFFYVGYLGGSNGDVGNAIAVDSAGNAYVTGGTSSTEATFPTGTGFAGIPSFDNTNSGSGDAFVVKLNPAGTALVYAGFIGGSGGESGRGIAVDSAGNAYICGTTGSTQATFPDGDGFGTLTGPDLTYNGGATDAFVAKLNAAGTALVYAGYLGGSNGDIAKAIAVDSAGNAYVTGDVPNGSGATFPTGSGFAGFSGADTTFNGGPFDAFVVKLNAAGTISYASFVGGQFTDNGNGIAVDSTGNVYLAGTTSSTEATFPNGNGIGALPGPDSTYNGAFDAFVVKLNAAGTAFTYAGFIGGSGGDSGSAIAVDSAGNAYLTGQTDSTQSSFPNGTGIGALPSPDNTFNGQQDAFVVKLNASGNGFVYAGYIGGNQTDQGLGIALDGLGNALIVGTTNSDQNSFPTGTGMGVLPGPDNTFNDGLSDAFVVKINNTGTGLFYAGYIGGFNEDIGNGIAVDSIGNAYVTGQTDSNQSTFPDGDGFGPLSGPDATFNGVIDAYVAKISAGILVTTTADTVAADGFCSLREAIQAANTNLAVNECPAGEAGLDVIQFNLNVAASTPTINVTSALPTITGPLVINGASGGATRIELNGSGAGAVAGLTFLNAASNGSTVRSLVINRFGTYGIELNGSSNNVIQDCYLGTDSTGALDRGNTQYGLLLNGSSNNLIGGTVAGTRNVISGNDNDGVVITSASNGNFFVGNYVGTNASGTGALGNGAQGINLLSSSANNIIGGRTAAERNVISGNVSNGINIGGANNNRVEGNYIGLDVTGTADLGNAQSGVRITGATTINNIIGGTAAGARNIISGNDQNGVLFDLSNTNNRVESNYIGLNAAGTAAIGNTQNGVLIQNSSNITIGGTAAGAGNVISGNVLNGVRLTANAAGNFVQGNFIGTNPAGTAAIGNVSNGVEINGSNNNTIGGSTTSARNLISGNQGTGGGIFINTATGNTVQGNYIGTDVTGNTAIANSTRGVALFNSANTNQVLGNLISGNVLSGVELAFSTINCVVQGNFIGTNAAGTGGLGNGGSGVMTSNNSNNNTIGGTASNESNTIAFNGTDGVRISASGTGNRIQRNAIFSNTNLGIDLSGNSVTANDAGDGDTGPNNLQNFPVLNFVTNAGFLSGMLDSTTLNAAYPARIEFFANTACDSTGNGEGEVFLGFINLAAPGAFTFNFTPIAGKTFITATATDNNGNTSEFSPCRQVGDTPAQTITVTTTTDVVAADGSCSLREAIQAANTNLQVNECNAGVSGLDNIIFSLGAGTPTINVTSALPTVTEPVTINGATGGATRVVLNGVGAGASVDGLTITAGSSTIRNLVINRFTRFGLRLQTGGGNTVAGCFIGLNAAGDGAQANQGGGLLIDGSPTSTIGGTTAADRNVISGNGVFGIAVQAIQPGAVTVIQGNYIGTNAAGTAAVPNADGIISDSGITVGGATAGAGNLISGNSLRGLLLASGNTVQGNLIGTNFDGSAALPNLQGVRLTGSNNTIGGTTAAARNLISGNTNNGLEMFPESANNNLVQGNFIGTNAAGTGALGNGGSGVLLQNASNNTIGGTAANTANVIAFNGIDGVTVTMAATGNRIQGNSIFSNTSLGIDLGGNGVTANDTGDGDTGPNNLQNFPVLTLAVPSGANTQITGTLNSTANLNFRIEFFSSPACDASGNGEGRVFLGATNITTDGSGNATINATVPAAVTPGQVVTATATDESNNTSEFSSCRTVTCQTITINPTTLPAGAVGVAYNQTLTQTGGNAPVTWSVGGGALPNGLTLSSGGLISGTPTLAGTFNFTAKATDANGCMGTRALALLVTSCVTLAPANQSFVTGGGNGNVQITASGGCNWTAVSNAPWLTVTGNSSGSGNGTVNYTVAANALALPRTGTLTIRGNTFVVSQAAAGSLVDTDFSSPFPPPGWTVQDGGTGVYPNNDPATWTNANPCGRVIPAPFPPSPPGSFAIVDASCAGPNAVMDEQLTTPPFNATGLGQVFVEFYNAFHWSPAGPNYKGIVQVSIDGGQTWTNVLVLQNGNDGPNLKSINITSVIAPNPANVLVRLSYNAAPTAPSEVQEDVRPGIKSPTQELEAYWAVDFSIYGFGISPQSQNFAASGGNGTVNVTAAASRNWTTQSNTPWITVNTAGGTGSGSANYTVASNPTTSPRTGTVTVAGNTFTVNQAGTCPSITVNPTTLPTGRAGTAYNQMFMQTGGTGTITWTVSAGTLPAGLTLSTAGVLSGTPTVSGAFNFTVRATDANTCFGERTYTLTLHPHCTTITVNPATLPAGFVGLAYNQTLTATGGTAPHTFAVTTGTLPNGLTLASGGALTGTPTTAGTFSFAVTATDSTGCLGTRNYTVIVSGAGLQFYPLAAPVRLLDTRMGTSPNACSQPNAPITGNTARTQPARSFCGIPANAQALTGNVTTVQSGGGFLTLYPSDAAQPTVASTNYSANEIINNVFTVGLGAADGAFKIFAFTTTDVVVDVTGYYAPPGAGGLFFHPLPAPVRLLETRLGETGCVTPGTPLTGNTESTQQALSACTGIPAAARAIAGNATTVGPQGDGFLTIFPADATRPLVASSNYSTNQIVNGPFAVGLAANGQFKIYTTSTTHLVVDVLGYYSSEVTDANGAGLLFTPLAHPIRLLETRTGQPVGCFKPNAPLNGQQEYTQIARGLCDGITIPTNALGVVGNATVVQPVGAGFLTLWPSTAARPLIATSNYNPGDIGNRHFIVGLGNADGAFKMYSFATTNLVVDLSGYFAP